MSARLMKGAAQRQPPKRPRKPSSQAMGARFALREHRRRGHEEARRILFGDPSVQVTFKGVTTA